MNVAIDPQAMPGTAGGVAQAAMSLVSGLGKLTDGSENYTIIVQSQEQMEWLKRYAGSNQRIVIKNCVRLHGGAQNFEERRRAFPQFLKRSLGPALPYLRFVRKLFWLKRSSAVNFPMRKYLISGAKLPSPSFNVHMSDGFYESLGCHVLHIPVQGFILSALPTIYNPHDLQHVHYPQFFPSSVLEWRDVVYPAGCHLAHTVVVGSQWIKDDVVRCFGVNPRKVQVIPEAAPTQLYGEPSKEFLTEVKNKYRIEQPFGFYPAVTWPHKQHIALLQAIARLRDKHEGVIRLVCTGSFYEPHWQEVKACVEKLNLCNQVKFLGFVPADDLRALYRLAQFLIQPSLFEASSLPIFEAWMEGIPIACSNVSALPDQVKDAGLLFDPHSVESIADAMKKLHSDSKLRQDLQARGFNRLKDFDLERTSKAIRAVYRRAAGFALTEEDRWLLKWDWMLEPQKKMEN